MGLRPNRGHVVKIKRRTGSYWVKIKQRTGGHGVKIKQGTGGYGVKIRTGGPEPTGDAVHTTERKEKAGFGNMWD